MLEKLLLVILMVRMGVFVVLKMLNGVGLINLLLINVCLLILIGVSNMGSVEDVVIVGISVLCEMMICDWV